jgi:hypothetical protein
MLLPEIDPTELPSSDVESRWVGIAEPDSRVAREELRLERCA